MQRPIETRLAASLEQRYFVFYSQFLTFKFADAEVVGMGPLIFFFNFMLE